MTSRRGRRCTGIAMIRRRAADVHAFATGIYDIYVIGTGNRVPASTAVGLVELFRVPRQGVPADGAADDVRVQHRDLATVPAVLDLVGARVADAADDGRRIVLVIKYLKLKFYEVKDFGFPKYFAKCGLRDFSGGARDIIAAIGVEWPLKGSSSPSFCTLFRPKLTPALTF